MQMGKRIIVGVTGASGIDVAREVLKLISAADGFESYLVMSNSARRTMELECSYGPDTIEKLADVVYANERIESKIASGYSDSLLLRAADVVLKERRKLVLAVREAPLNGIHLRNLQTLWEMGADIMPLMMTFYNKPSTIEDMVHHLACKCVERLGIEPDCFKRW